MASIEREQLDRMKAYAEAAKGHPTWSVAYAEDVPVLLAENERLQHLLVLAVDHLMAHDEHCAVIPNLMSEVGDRVRGG